MTKAPEVHAEQISHTEAMLMTEYGRRLAARKWGAKKDVKTLRMIDVDGVWIPSPERQFGHGADVFEFKITFP